MILCALLQGVIRTLSHGFTLKQKGPTGWVIDLTVPGLHKTSRCYGPSITPVSSLVVPALEKLIRVRKGDGFDFVDQDDAPDNRTAREYLFHCPAQHSVLRRLRLEQASEARLPAPFTQQQRHSSPSAEKRLRDSTSERSRLPQAICFRCAVPPLTSTMILPPRPFPYTLRLTLFC